MSLDLESLKYVYESIDKDLLERLEITDFRDFKNYIVETIISNLEYDFNIDSDLIDMNNFVKGGCVYE